MFCWFGSNERTLEERVLELENEVDKLRTIANYLKSIELKKAMEKRRFSQHIIK